MEHLTHNPRTPYDYEEFGLDPEGSAGDRWVMQAARGDQGLLLEILTEEHLGRLHASGAAGSDYLERMSRHGERITERTRYLDGQS
jgi:hypothetical protein